MLLPLIIAYIGPVAAAIPKVCSSAEIIEEMYECYARKRFTLKI